MKMRPRASPKTIQNRPKSIPRGDFFAVKFRPRFGIDFGAILAPKMLPLGTLLTTTIHQKNDQKLDCSKCRCKIATRPFKTAPGPPKTTPRPPKSSLRHPQDLPKCPQELPRSPQNSPRCSQETRKSPQDTVKHLLAGFLCIKHE